MRRRLERQGGKKEVYQKVGRNDWVEEKEGQTTHGLELIEKETPVILMTIVSRAGTRVDTRVTIEISYWR